MRAAVRLFPVAALVALVLVLTTLDMGQEVLPPRAPARAADADTVPRLIVVFADGLDAGLVRERLDRGDLPNLAALAETGTFVSLATELPPESPVAMASLLTGVNPGRHGVFDFVVQGDGYRPVNGMVDVLRARVALGRFLVRPPRVQSRLAAPTFTDIVRDAGYPVVSHRQPLAFPVAHKPGAWILSGLGTPDLAGSAGLYAVYSSRRGFLAGETTFGGRRIPLNDQRDETEFVAPLFGPPDPSKGRGEDGRIVQASVPMRFERNLDARTVTVCLGDTSAMIGLDADGRGRTPFLPVEFTLGTVPGKTVRGRVRLQITSLEPLEAFSDPVQIDPLDPILPISEPAQYAGELWREYGGFETLGWAEQTFQLNDGWQSDQGFLQDLLEDMDRSEALFLGEMRRRPEARLVCCTVTSTDRAQHAFWRMLDRGHPLHPTEDQGDPIGVVLQRFDKMVGRIRERLAPGDRLLIASDHGFTTWRWGIHLNQWLVNKGYLKLERGATPRTLHGFFGDGIRTDLVDWKHTKAYAMGLGQIYVNLTGRERDGIVAPADRAALVEEIRKGLLALENPYLREDSDLTIRPIRDVVDLHATYSGPLVSDAPDMQVLFERGYRVSWQTALLGGMSHPGTLAVFERNDLAWSGDHCSSHPDIVPGVLFLSWRPERTTAPGEPGPHVRDVAPTVLAHFGLDASNMDGRALGPGPARRP